MDKVAEAEGLEPSMGQSPFAISRGQIFERELLAEQASRLIKTLKEALVIPESAAGLGDLRLRMNGGPVADLDTALDETAQILRAAAQCDQDKLYASVPAVIASATLRVPGQPVMLPDGIVAIDALVLRPDESSKQVELVIGEIKSYPYRAGDTDPIELSTTRAQAGVYQHALELAVDDAGLETKLTVCSQGFLVLTRHGSNNPQILANEQLDFQAARARRGFARLRAAAMGLKEFDPADDEKAILEIQGAQTAYTPECLNFCDRAPGCRKSAEELGDASVLGSDVARFLAGVKLDRAVELLNGAEPVGAVEADLVHRMADAGGNGVA